MRKEVILNISHVQIANNDTESHLEMLVQLIQPAHTGLCHKQQSEDMKLATIISFSEEQRGTHLAPQGSDSSKWWKRAECCFGFFFSTNKVAAVFWHTAHTCAIPQEHLKRRLF